MRLDLLLCSLVVHYISFDFSNMSSLATRTSKFIGIVGDKSSTNAALNSKRNRGSSKQIDENIN